jgi:hypothetical protein
MSNIRHDRLRNQQLSAPTLKAPSEVLRSMVAIQAQDYYGAKWALGLRCSLASDKKIEQAFNDGHILRLHVMRPTWHFVAAEDIRWLSQLTASRVSALCRSYYRKAELDDKILRRTNKLIAKKLRDGRQLTRSELKDAAARSGLEPGDSPRFAHILLHAELSGLICSGARRGGQFTYALLDERVPQAKILQRDEALGELVLRYFSSRGPATMADFAWWSGLTMLDAKRGIDINSNQLTKRIDGGKTYWCANEASIKRSRCDRVHLLPTFDEYFIAYKDRSATLHPKWNQKELESSAVFTAPMVLDGQLVGGWKRTLSEDSVMIELNPLIKLTRSDIRLFTLAAASYARFLDKDYEIKFV